MKEASGELSMTAIVVVVLGILAAFAPIIIKTVGNSMKMRAACQAAYGCGICNTGTNTRECKYRADDDSEKTITCSCNSSDYNN